MSAQELQRLREEVKNLRRRLKEGYAVRALAIEHSEKLTKEVKRLKDRLRVYEEDRGPWNLSQRRTVLAFLLGAGASTAADVASCIGCAQSTAKRLLRGLERTDGVVCLGRDWNQTRAPLRWEIGKESDDLL